MVLMACLEPNRTRTPECQNQNITTSVEQRETKGIFLGIPLEEKGHQQWRSQIDARSARHPASEVRYHSLCWPFPCVHMRTLLFVASLLCLFLAPALDVSASALVQRSIPEVGQDQEGDMASTALDFREMMRKERELAMKQRVPDATTTTARYVGNAFLIGCRLAARREVQVVGKSFFDRWRLEARTLYR